MHRTHKAVMRLPWLKGGQKFCGGELVNVKQLWPLAFHIHIPKTCMPILPHGRLAASRFVRSLTCRSLMWKL